MVCAVNQSSKQMSSIAWTFPNVADPDVYSESQIGIFSILDPGIGSATLAHGESHSHDECLRGQVGCKVSIALTGNAFEVRQHLYLMSWRQVGGEFRLSHAGSLVAVRKHLPDECVWDQEV